MRPVFVSPQFQRLLLDDDGSFRGKLGVEWEEFVRARLVRTVEDPETGLMKHFRFKPDLRFVEVKAVGPLPSLTDRDLSTIMQHLTEPEVSRKFFPPETFEFHGFTAIHAVDVTLSEVISELGRDLIVNNSIVPREGFSRLQDRLRTLFGRPEGNV